MNRQEAASAIETLLSQQAELYVSDTDRPSLEGWAMTHWVGVSSWSAIDDDGDEVTRLIVHLRDYQMPGWQIVGLLRAALLTQEGSYLSIGLD